MRHILFNRLGFSEKDFDDNMQLSNSHNELINKIWEKITIDSDARDFKIKIGSLKRMRKDADYKQIIIYQRDSEDAKQYATIINNNLKYIFLK